MPTSTETIEEKVARRRIVKAEDVDVAAYLVTDTSAHIDPLEAARVRRKIDLYLLPLMCTLYCVQFMDKTTLGSAAIMGIIESNHLSNNEFNWLGTIFYIGYLLFEFPQSLCLQRFPVGKWMSVNILAWGIALCCHAACTDFYGLLVVRFILGVAEASITAGFLIISSMFYTRAEHIARVGLWYSCIGVASLVSGFIGFGVLHVKDSALMPWQWLMIITGLITLLCGLAFCFRFPDSPTTAWFLTPEERLVAVKRLQKEQTGVENKRFKKEQFWEAICDTKIWLFALYGGTTLMSGSLTNQRWIIVSSFGFTELQTVLLGCVDGILITVLVIGASTAAGYFPNARGYISAGLYIPAILGAVLIQTLSEENSIGLLFSYWLTIPAVAAYPLVLSWGASVVTGHTKKGTMNALVLCGYCIGYGSGQFIWQKKNRIPWIIISCCFAFCICIIMLIRLLLARENARRDREKSVDEEISYLEVEKGDGEIEMIQVDKVIE